MTYRLPSSNSSLPIIRSKRLLNPIELYSLFHYDGFTWKRCSDNAYSLKLAYRVFTERLISNPQNYRIQQIKVQPLSANIKYGR